MLRLTQGIDGLGQPLLAVAQQSDTINNYVLAVNTAKYPVVPTGANFVKIGQTVGADLLVLLNATSGLTVPSSDVTNGAGVEVNPDFLSLNGAATIGIISPEACLVSLSYFA